MREEMRAERRREIEAAACELLEKKGYAGASILSIATAAGASNETLYRWYGDKKGLFRAIAEANAEAIRQRLDAALDGKDAPEAALKDVSVPLLSMVTGERAVALNRAAAGDPTGELGAAIAEGGRDAVMPRLAALMAAGQAAGQIKAGEPEADADLYLRLLVGDWQVRRVIGAMALPAARDIARRAEEALTFFWLLRAANSSLTI